MQIEADVRSLVRHGTDASIEMSCGPTEPDHCEVVITMKNCPKALVDYLSLPGEPKTVTMELFVPDPGEPEEPDTILDQHEEEDEEPEEEDEE